MQNIVIESQIRKLIKENNLVSGYIDLEAQVQPEGFDLSIKSVEKIRTSTIPIIGFKSSDTRLPDTSTVEMRKFSEWLKWTLGSHKIKNLLDFTKGQYVEWLTAQLEPVLDQEGWYLDEGVYILTFNEVIKLPNNLYGKSQLRSTLMRQGIEEEVGHWDAGYEGRGQSKITIKKRHPLIILKDARVAQIHFHPRPPAKNGYNGSYQHENIQPR